MAELLSRIRGQCRQRRICLEEFLKSFDVHHTKKVSRPQFARAPGGAGLRLSQAEADGLMDDYSANDLGVHNLRFCDDVDQVWWLPLILGL